MDNLTRPEGFYDQDEDEILIQFIDAQDALEDFLREKGVSTILLHD